MTDFNQAHDIIQRHGAAADYQLNTVSVGNTSGTGIYMTQNGLPSGELIGIVQGDTADLDLTASYFDYVS
ncbi:MAG: hypothetical protein AAFY20_26385 [Cyanobacteria bacterium J06639_14]